MFALKKKNEDVWNLRVHYDLEIKMACHIFS